MTTVAPSVPGAPTRVRIAITSPEILAQIRQVFAGKNLAVDIVRAPYVEVAVRPTGVTAPARVPAGGSVPRRLRAAYRLNVVEVETPAATAPAVTLSRRQHEVMTLVSAGLRNQEIAARLGVSEKTVKNHINRIFRSLGVTSRVEAVLRWQRHPRATPPPALAETP